MLTPFVASSQKIAVGTGMIVVLLDQLDLKLAGKAQCERKARGRRWLSAVTVICRDEITQQKERPDT